VFVDHSVIDPRSKSFSNEATTEQDGKKETSGLVTNLENFAMLLDSLKNADSLFVQNNMDSLIAAHQLNESITFSIDTTARSKDTARSFVKINSSGLGFNINTTRLAP
jgi:CMP-N-acetylneuraminic acid synthetase